MLKRKASFDDPPSDRYTRRARCSVLLRDTADIRDLVEATLKSDMMPILIYDEEDDDWVGYALKEELDGVNDEHCADVFDTAVFEALNCMAVHLDESLSASKHTSAATASWEQIAKDFSSAAASSPLSATPPGRIGVIKCLKSGKEGRIMVHGRTEDGKDHWKCLDPGTITQTADSDVQMTG